MLFVESLVGIILIICGLLVKKYPNLIAGYNTMSETEKKKINIERLSNYMHNSLIIIGALSIIISVILFFLDVKETYRLMINTGIILIGLMIMIFKGNSNAFRN